MKSSIISSELRLMNFEGDALPSRDFTGDDGGEKKSLSSSWFYSSESELSKGSRSRVSNSNLNCFKFANSGFSV
jgi:hypothetical protein